MKPDLLGRHSLTGNNFRKKYRDKLTVTVSIVFETVFDVKVGAEGWCD